TGRKEEFLSVGRGRGGPVAVLIAITALHHPTVTIADALHGGVRCGDVKGATAAHRDPTEMDPRLLARWHHRTHQIPRLKSLDPTGSFGPGAGEPKAIHQADLSAAMPTR